MRYLFVSSVIVLGIISGLSAAEAYPKASRSDGGVLSLYFENDLFADTDQQYTNGTKIGWVSPDLEEFAQTYFPRFTEFFAEKVPYLRNDELSKNVAFSIGQNMYTPENIITTDLVENDRPYAAWLYLGAGFHMKDEKFQNTFEIQLGVVGPSALGKEIQDFVHDRRGIPRANGWANQLDDELGINLIAEHRRRLNQNNIGKGWEMDATANGSAVLGNVSTYVNAGIEGRLGYNLPLDFGTTHIRPGGETNIPVLPGIHRKEETYSFLLFASMDGRAVARDIFLDGNTFADSHSVRKEPLVADFAMGVTDQSLG
ncbi:MAG: lipid A deacylase LpxR family protein [Verrucomicrobia bacterium]|nr:lipid A deacylase LpxR family protein [Verrucomicrobiota bacterium]MDA1066556.1 lipid A deacylase LpxR family protein [Verrucomicrobiota bacterium]